MEKMTMYKTLRGYIEARRYPGFVVEMICTLRFDWRIAELALRYLDAAPSVDQDYWVGYEAWRVIDLLKGKLKTIRGINIICKALAVYSPDSPWINVHLEVLEAICYQTRLLEPEESLADHFDTSVVVHIGNRTLEIIGKGPFSRKTVRTPKFKEKLEKIILQVIEEIISEMADDLLEDVGDPDF